MAGDWIPISVDLPYKPEVVRLAAALRCTTDEVVGMLVRFWSWAQAHTADGTLPHMDADKLAMATHIRRRFFVELEQVGWLQFTESGASIPAFSRWFTGAAKRRLRDRHRKEAVHADCATFPQQFRNVSANFPQSFRKVSACDAEKMRTTEEERIEQEKDISNRMALFSISPEKKINSIGNSDIDCTEEKRGEAVTDSSPPPVPPEVAHLTFPCRGAVAEWTVPASLYQQLVEHYPTLDVAGEIVRAHAWILTNGSRRKTARGMARFLNGWLARACGRGPPRPADGRDDGDPLGDDYPRANYWAVRLVAELVPSYGAWLQRHRHRREYISEAERLLQRCTPEGIRLACRWLAWDGPVDLWRLPWEIAKRAGPPGPTQPEQQEVAPPPDVQRQIIAELMAATRSVRRPPGWREVIGSQ